MESSKTTDEAQIRGLIDERVQAVRDKDIDRAMYHIAQDILSFDLINPLQYCGSDSLRKRAAEWFASFEGPIGFELRDLNIVTGGDVAFSTASTGSERRKKMHKTSKCGGAQAFATAKLTATWTVVHEHNSVPFDPQHGKASLDLKP